MRPSRRVGWCASGLGIEARPSRAWTDAAGRRAARSEPEEVEATAFDPFDVQPACVAVYHLGNNATARHLLKTWPPSGQALA